MQPDSNKYPIKDCTYRNVLFNGKWWSFALSESEMQVEGDAVNNGAFEFVTMNNTIPAELGTLWVSERVSTQAFEYQKELYFISRGSAGISTFRFSTDDPSSSMSRISHGILTGDLWKAEKHYLGIHVIELKGKVLLVTRGEKGLSLYEFQEEEFNSLILDSGIFAGTSTWNARDRYLTFRSFVYKDELYFICRGKSDLQTYKYNESESTIEKINAASNNDMFPESEGWNLPEYYETIQMAELDGQTLIVGRGKQGLETYQFDGTHWRRLAKETGVFSDYNGWNRPEQYQTIQTFNYLDGLYIMGRGAAGLWIYKWKNGQWEPRLKRNGKFTDQEGWNLESRWTTLWSFEQNGQLYVAGRNSWNTLVTHPIFTHDADVVDLDALDESLLLQLYGDEILNDDQLLDYSDHRNHAKLYNDLELVPDDQFGSCLYFSNEDEFVEAAIRNTEFSSVFTLAFWGHMDQGSRSGRRYGLLTYGNDQGSIEVEYTGNEAVLQFFLKLPGEEEQVFHLQNLTDSWHHFALTFHKDGKFQLYVDGVVEHVSTAKVALTGGRHFVRFGKSTSHFFEGKLAHMKLYHQALNYELLQDCIQEDLDSGKVFKYTHPIDFEIEDQEGNFQLAISDDTETRQTCLLTIRNTTSAQIQFQDPGDDPYFTLSFRPNTFSNFKADLVSGDLRIVGDDQAFWSIQSEIGMDDEQMLHFFRTDAAKVLRPDGELQFLWTYQSADALLGARNTTTMLSYGHLSFADDTGELHGQRLKHLNIVNKTGVPQIPLYAGVIGNNKVLNYANEDSAPKTSATSIVIRLKNISSPRKNKRIAFKEDTLSKSQSSKILVSFEPETEDSGLTSKSFLSKIKASVSTSSGQTGLLKVARDDQGTQTVFMVETVSTFELGPREYLDIRLENIISVKPSGLTRIYLDYENIPGYWDGQFTVEVEKTPITTDENSHVGIGVAPDPENRLFVGGSTKIEGDLQVTKLDNVLPVGTIVMWHGEISDIKKGWALCDGGYYDMYGNREDSDGPARVKTPDLRGRFIVGVNPEGDGDSKYKRGDQGGEDEVKLTTSEMPSHGHGVTDNGHSHGYRYKNYTDRTVVKKSGMQFDVDYSFNEIDHPNNDTIYATRSSGSGIQINSNGGGKPHENRPPYYALYYIMKVFDSEMKIPVLEKSNAAFLRNGKDVVNVIKQIHAVVTIPDLDPNDNCLQKGPGDVYQRGNKIWLDNKKVPSYGPYNQTRNHEGVDFFISVKDQQFFLLGTEISKAIYINGHMMVYGNGGVSVHTFEIGNWQIVVKRISDAPEEFPSVNHIFLFPKGVNFVHNYEESSYMEMNEIQFGDGQLPTLLYYFIWYGEAGYWYSDAEVEKIAAKLIEALELK